jgi:hypothetical protein
MIYLNLCLWVIFTLNLSVRFKAKISRYELRLLFKIKFWGEVLMWKFKEEFKCKDYVWVLRLKFVVIIYGYVICLRFRLRFNVTVQY